MFRFFVVAACAIAMSSAGIAKHHNVVVEHDGHGGHSGGDFQGHGGHHGGYHGGKDHHGAELSSLAHSSAINAKNALRYQHAAGSQADHGVKSSLASAAFGAAQAAHAALIGKQALVAGLKKQLEEAEHQLAAELSQYQQTENSAHAAQEAAHQAQTQLTAVAAATAAAQAGVQHAQQAVAEAANSAAVQQQMVEEAKHRVAHISGQIKYAYDDLRDTEAAAHKAAEAAHLAQTNAAAAANAVAEAAAKGGHSGHHH